MVSVKTYSALVKEFDKRASVAVENVAKVVCDKLRECINEQYYNDPDFYPNIYKRTYAFLESAMYEMMGMNTAIVGVNSSSMHYKNGFSGAQVVEWASQSMHGAEYYQTSTEPFWDTFIQWADKNVVQLLKSELKKQGFTIK